MLVVVLFCILAALTSASVVSRKERSPRDKESDEISSKFLQEARRLRKRTLGGKIIAPYQCDLHQTVNRVFVSQGLISQD